ncbi:MAG: ribulose-phosphate 3-epimerase [Bacteroidales bacterium]|nr:ribulose-phosphate 3-epimerase [Bacteroidales bacterium]MDY4175517.1 ribulose-phosphate 3-epimerase [Bacteroidales bacterium]
MANRSGNVIVSPSALAADFLHLDNEIEMINASEADWLHVDVMDGVFVPNISIGSPIIKSIGQAIKKPMDVHLMIVDPGRYIGMFRDLGAHLLNVHYEACTHLHRVVQQIRDAGMRPAVTLNPATPVSVLEEIITEVDMVLLMSVNPGFGGQKFIVNTLDKIARLRKLIDSRGAKTLIEIDGGINAETGAQCVAAGADVLVAGSYVFANKDPKEAIRTLKSL